jgi:hypothetical protein
MHCLLLPIYSILFAFFFLAGYILFSSFNLLHSFRVEKIVQFVISKLTTVKVENTLVSSGKDSKIHSKRVENSFKKTKEKFCISKHRSRVCRRIKLRKPHSKRVKKIVFQTTLETSVEQVLKTTLETSGEDAVQTTLQTGGEDDIIEQGSFGNSSSVKSRTSSSLVSSVVLQNGFIKTPTPRKHHVQNTNKIESKVQYDCKFTSLRSSPIRL